MKKSITYSGIVLCISYIFAGILYITGVLNPSTQFIISSLYMFMPLLSAFIFDRLVYKNNPVDSWGLKFKFSLSLFLPLLFIPAFVVLTLVVNTLFPGTELVLNHIEASKNMMTPEQFEAARPQLESFSPALFYLLQIVSGIIAGYTINAFFAFGEEVGWRGSLLKTFEGKPFWQACLFSGAVWGIWHAPLVLLGHNYPEHPQIGVAMMVIWCILLTPIFIYVRVKSKSVFVASFLHGFLNAIAGFSLLLIVGGNDLTKGVTGAAGMIALLIINIALLFFDQYISKDRIMTSAISLNNFIEDAATQL
ncbi:MAG: CPBP family intramembrane metalloprotease [Oscillospiraceae bacterium]|nr:CPBP family intramembrane metalloprotease [Oscillospiraceae bacterium]